MQRSNDKKRTKISFIIPAHNEEQYLARSLESILKEIGREHYNAEVIVVNNASTDNTEGVVKEYPNVRLVVENRKGTCFARMAGFLASEGELVANIDADTCIMPGWIETALGEFKRKSNLVALSGPCKYDLSPQFDFAAWIYYCVLYAVYAVGHRLFGTSSVILGGNFIARRSALQAIGGYNTDMTFYGDDPDLAKRLVKVGIVKFTFRLMAHTSGRRFRVEGVVKTVGRYVLNYFWVIFFSRPFTRQAVHARFKENGAA